MHKNDEDCFASEPKARYATIVPRKTFARGMRRVEDLMSDKKMELAEVQSAELEILKALVAFCDAHHLRYSMIYGSLIGVVRHGGFIPWDDDIDIAMPRPDYERLIALSESLKEETGFTLVGLKGQPLEIAPIVKVCDDRIAVLERGGMGEGSLWVDVFPVDGLPDDDKLAQSHCAKIWRKRMLLVAQTSPVSSAKTFSRKAVKLMAKATRVFTNPRRLSEQITELAKRYPFDEAQEVNAITWSDYGFSGRFGREAFENEERRPFEDMDVSVISDFDRNLSGIYGEYMQIPPVEKRDTHSLIAWPREGRSA